MYIKTKQQFNVEVVNTSFENNNRAINVELISEADQSIVLIDHCNFTGNIAGGPGGGVFIDQTYGAVATNIQHCRFTNNWAVELHNSQNMDTDNLDISKITGSGGAVAVNTVPVQSSSSLMILDSVFTNNTADTYGGTLYIGVSVKCDLKRNVYENIDIAGRSARPQFGDIIESRGRMLIVDDVFNVRTAERNVPILSYRSSEINSFIEVENVSYYCPVGYDEQSVVSSIELNARRKPIETLLLYCVPCVQTQYSLEPTQLTINDLNFTRLSTATCSSCPYGAECDIDVRSKANFWGNEHNNEIQMYLCPDDYCCQNLTCINYNECAPNRIGLLCGECDVGYSESLFSTECILNSECTYATTFWLVVVLYGMVYVVFFVLEDEWQMILNTFTEWLKSIVFKLTRRLRKVRAASSATAKAQEDLQSHKLSESNVADTVEDIAGTGDDIAGAYVSIFMYYIQIPSLLKVTILYRDQTDVPLEDMLNAIKNIFSFNTFGINYKTCLFQGTKAVFKIWIKSAFIIYLFFILIVIYMIVKPIARILANSQLKDSIFKHSASVNAKFTCALVSLLLYTYQYFAENGFNMLKCVEVTSEGSSMLFIDAHIKCYQPWQYIVLAFVCIYVIPFAFVLSLGPDLLRRKIIRVRIFIVSLFLPLFSTPYLLYKFIIERQFDRRNETKSRGHYEHTKNMQQPHKGGRDLVNRLLAEPYKNTFAWGICWEGVIALRRLVLVILATFIPSLLARHILILCICVLALILQLIIKPFSKFSCNILETASLTILLSISVMNLLKAVYFQAGEVPESTAEQIFTIYDWYEAVMLGVIPLCIIALVVLLILCRLLSLPFQKYFSKRERHTNDRHNLSRTLDLTNSHSSRSSADFSNTISQQEYISTDTDVTFCTDPEGNSSSNNRSDNNRSDNTGDNTGDNPTHLHNNYTSAVSESTNSAQSRFAHPSPKFYPNYETSQNRFAYH